MLRQAIAEDADVIAQLEMQLFPDNCMNETTVRNELAAGDGYVIYDACQNEKLIGYTIVRRDGDITDLLRIGVHPDYQSQGYGLKLLKVTSGTNLRYHPIMLTVRKDNTRAIRLYKWVGFKIVGQLEAYGEQSWVMLLTSWLT